MPWASSIPKMNGLIGGKRVSIGKRHPFPLSGRIIRQEGNETGSVQMIPGLVIDAREIQHGGEDVSNPGRETKVLGFKCSRPTDEARCFDSVLPNVRFIAAQFRSVSCGPIGFGKPFAPFIGQIGTVVRLKYDDGVFIEPQFLQPGKDTAEVGIKALNGAVKLGQNIRKSLVLVFLIKSREAKCIV